MDNDVLARLRRADPISAQRACGSTLLADAGAEIVRLRSYNEGMAKIQVEMEAEIERLRAALTRAEATLVQVGILNASGCHPDPEIDRAIREYAVEQAVKE